VITDQDFVLLAVVTPEPTPEPTTAEPTDPPTTVDPTDEPTDPTAPPTTGSPTSPAPGTTPPGGPGGPGAPGSGGGGLPVTGGDPAAPLAVAALLVVVGIGTLAVRRRAGARG
jgi:LPXTG-motif cell wall-anchored protein